MSVFEQWQPENVLKTGLIRPKTAIYSGPIQVDSEKIQKTLFGAEPKSGLLDPKKNYADSTIPVT
jgi:hypothetical protein